LNKRADVTAFLALAGILLLLWPDERVVFAVLITLVFQLSREAARWASSTLPRWLRLAIALAATGGVVSFFIFSPSSTSESLARIFARSAGAAALIVMTWRAAAWENLPDRAR
jgi:hypothetical protein